MSSACSCPKGHCFCYQCIHRNIVVYGETRCPCDNDSSARLSLDDIRPVLNLRNVIENLTVRCAEERCDWTGRLAVHEVHKATCARAVVCCSYSSCNSRSARGDLAAHQSQCQYRLVNCPDCRQEMQALFIEAHGRTHCMSALVSCRFNCGGRIARYFSNFILVFNCISCFQLYKRKKKQLDFAFCTFS